MGESAFAPRSADRLFARYRPGKAAGCPRFKYKKTIKNIKLYKYNKLLIYTSEA